MLANYFNCRNVLIDLEVDNPVDAIRAAGQLLLDNEKILKSYIDKLVEAYQTLGAYIVLAPGIAMPHARPGSDVLETCISFTKLKNPVKFNHPLNDPVKYVFALGGVDEHGHLDMLRELSTFLMEEENLKKLEEVKTCKDFINLITKGDLK